MNLLNFYEIVFWCILFILAIYHLYKREMKLMIPLILIFALSFLSAFLNATLQIKIDVFSNIIYLAILIMTLYLGGPCHFYDKYKWWDRLIHFLSGVGFVGFGIAIARIDTGTIKWVILLFGFTFSLTLHAFWEVAEYINDCLTHGNAQRWQKIHNSNNHISERAIQPAGLVDTMNDIICCIIGSFLSIIAWWVFL